MEIKPNNIIVNKEINECVCKVCGKPFIKNSNKQMYCSESCRRNSNKHNARKSSYKYLKNHPTLKKYKEIALKNYGYKCAVCGWCYQEPITNRGELLTKSGCDVHHIIPVSKGGNDDIENLIVLCPNCHKIAHINEDESKEFLKKCVKIKSQEELEKDELEMENRFYSNIEKIFTNLGV